jgi:hypothetical protein
MEKTMKFILALLFAILLIPSAYAQKTGPNGGLLGGKDGHELELVVTAKDLTVFIIDHGKVHSTKGVSLRAVIQQGGKSMTIPLVDVGGTKLTSELKAPLGPGAIVVITGKDDHGDVLSARYTIK